MEKTRLKGGSLSGTYLCVEPGSSPFIRKEVSLVSNREYGFQRWYSQLKRMQRYSVMFPGVFPSLITYGKQGDTAYFDMEYIPDSVTVHEYLTRTSDAAKIDALLKELISVMRTMHQVVIPSTADALDLYIFEEIEQRIAACMGNKRFRDFFRHSHVYFNGERVPALGTVLDVYKEMARRSYQHTVETFTHGNLTLENILYQPGTGRIVFIDPYEENVIDSVLAEYSQVYQSSNSKYELYNEGTPSINENHVELSIPRHAGLDYFNDRFTEFVAATCTPNDRIAIKLLEISQYARMLPFKMEIDEDKMIFFYALGSYLFHTLREQWLQEN